jgi:RNA-directed DNA polymerase
VEPRAGTEGNARQQRTRRAQNRESVSQKLELSMPLVLLRQWQELVRQAAKLRKKDRFTALLHHVTVEFLEKAFYALRRKAAPGVDGQTWNDYEGNLEAHLRDLHGRIHSGAYRALPFRLRFILKADGKQRPLGVTALEDKIDQRAVVEILNAVYEADFLG